MNSQSSSRGNVLFLILIAVALFAALSYAVTQSTRSGGGNADKEKIQNDISVMLQYGASLRTGVQRLMISKSCTDEQLSAYSSNYASGASDYNNVNSPADKHCHIFDPAGAGAVFQKPPASVKQAGGVDYDIVSLAGIWGIGLDDCAHTELLLTTKVSRNMCLMINDKLGITNPAGNPPGASYNGGTYWARYGWGSSPGGSEYGCGMRFGAGGDAPELNGAATGCIQNTDTADQYFFYDVLLAR